MNSVDGFLILADDKVTTNDVVVIQNFGIVAIEHALNERVIVVKYCHRMTDVVSGLDSLPVIFEVQPVFCRYFCK